MRDDLFPIPDLTLILGPEDEAHFLGMAAGKGDGAFYAAVHRTHGIWTHVYRIANDRAPGRLLVHLAAVFKGDCLEAARTWAAKKITTPTRQKANL